MDIHLIDGTYELFRAYYGAPSARGPKGAEVGAVRVFLRSLYRFLQEPGVTHVALAFDTVIESFRNELFSDYKTGEGMDPELAGQFPLVERAAAALGCVVWPMIEFEADDAIATAAARWQDDPAVGQVFMCSPDKDFAQCVRGNKVIMWDRLRERFINEAGVVEKFGVSPASIPDWLALVGDTADGIPGVPKWGAKSASQILAHYQHLEAIPRDASKWAVKLRGASGLAESLAAHRKELMLYRKLATLRRDAPLPEKLSDLRWQGPKLKALGELCAEIGDTTFLQRFA